MDAGEATSREALRGDHSGLGERLARGAFRSSSAGDVRTDVLDRTAEVGDRVHRLPPLHPEWCAAFLAAYTERVAELAAAGRKPAPPNSLHEAGAALEGLGWSSLFDEALDAWLRPVCAELFPDLGGATLDSVHAFVAEYGEGADEVLAYHADDSELTLNLCLGGDFRGSELYFRGRRCEGHRQTPWSRAEAFDYEHEPGVAILHAGAHRHGVEWIEGGRRSNLILWLRSSALRAEASGEQTCPSWCGAHDATAQPRS